MKGKVWTCISKKKSVGGENQNVNGVQPNTILQLTIRWSHTVTDGSFRSCFTLAELGRPKQNRTTVPPVGTDRLRSPLHGREVSMRRSASLSALNLICAFAVKNGVAATVPRFLPKGCCGPSDGAFYEAVQSFFGPRWAIFCRIGRAPQVVLGPSRTLVDCICKRDYHLSSG